MAEITHRDYSLCDFFIAAFSHDVRIDKRFMIDLLKTLQPRGLDNPRPVSNRDRLAGLHVVTSGTRIADKPADLADFRWSTE